MTEPMTNDAATRAPRDGDARFVDETDFLLARAGRAWLAIDAQAIVELCERRRLTPIPHAPAHIPGVFQLRDAAVPALDVARFLELEQGPGAQGGGAEGPGRFVVVRASGMRVGLMCEQTTRITTLLGAPRVEVEGLLEARVQALIVACVEASEGVVLVLDLEGLLEAARVQGEAG